MSRTIRDSEFVVEILFAPYAGYAALIVGIRHASLIVGTIFGRNSLAVTHYCTPRHQCWRGSRPPKGIEPFDYSESAPGGGNSQKGAPTVPCTCWRWSVLVRVVKRSPSVQH